MTKKYFLTEFANADNYFEKIDVVKHQASSQLDKLLAGGWVIFFSQTITFFVLPDIFYHETHPLCSLPNIGLLITLATTTICSMCWLSNADMDMIVGHDLKSSHQKSFSDFEQHVTSEDSHELLIKRMTSISKKLLVCVMSNVIVTLVVSVATNTIALLITGMILAASELFGLAWLSKQIKVSSAVEGYAPITETLALISPDATSSICHSEPVFHFYQTASGQNIPLPALQEHLANFKELDFIFDDHQQQQLEKLKHLINNRTVWCAFVPTAVEQINSVTDYIKHSFMTEAWNRGIDPDTFIKKENFDQLPEKKLIDSMIKILFEALDKDLAKTNEFVHDALEISGEKLLDDLKGNLKE